MEADATVNKVLNHIANKTRLREAEEVNLRSWAGKRDAFGFLSSGHVSAGPQSWCAVGRAMGLKFARASLVTICDPYIARISLSLSCLLPKNAFPAQFGYSALF